MESMSVRLTFGMETLASIPLCCSRILRIMLMAATSSSVSSSSPSLQQMLKDVTPRNAFLNRSLSEEILTWLVVT